MFRRIWNYIKQWFRGTAERAMDPEVEIEVAITDARKRDQELRNQAAKVIAHRTQLEQKLEQSADTVGETREMAKQALLRENRPRRPATPRRRASGTRRRRAWRSSSRRGEQPRIAQGPVRDSGGSGRRRQGRRPAERHAAQELAAKRMQLLGSLQQARMQEAVNSAVESISANMESEAPSLEKVEDKINQRLASAKARTELRRRHPQVPKPSCVRRSRWQAPTPSSKSCGEAWSRDRRPAG